MSRACILTGEARRHDIGMDPPQPTRQDGIEFVADIPLATPLGYGGRYPVPSMNACAARLVASTDARIVSPTLGVHRYLGVSDGAC